MHPVAVLIARVTFLLAIGEERLRERPPSLAIPVYLGDSLQWNTEAFFAKREVLIRVPKQDPKDEKEKPPVLHFPATIASEPAVFDSVVQTMLAFSEDDADESAFGAWLTRQHPDLDSSEVDGLTSTYRDLRDLRRAGRNHIWGYVARNLGRPIWLSSPGQHVDVVVGNPPWLSYRYMDDAMQVQFRDECQRRGLWIGGKLATHQDLSAYFFARSVELYLRQEGTIAFVMPYAALNRKQFEGFRTGSFGSAEKKKKRPHVYSEARFIEAWAYDETVQPLFPVPSCVLIGERKEAGALPATVTACSGTLPRRDATAAEARAALHCREQPWPDEAAMVGGSPYREAFKQGATIVPRKLAVVQFATTGRLGSNRDAPVVESRPSVQEKEPWRSLDPLRGSVEREFVRPLYLGESVAPFRLLQAAHTIVPWTKGEGLLDSAGLRKQGYPHAARWFGKAEDLWEEHRRNDRLSLIERLDFYRLLSGQMPPAKLRILYAASGTLPAAAVLTDRRAVVEHSLYWAAVETIEEARYLEAILNSEALRSTIANLQARGQWGARHFDKLPFEQAIPAFDGANRTHVSLADAASEAERIAAGVEVSEEAYFVTTRTQIRAALVANGVSTRIDELVFSVLQHVVGA